MFDCVAWMRAARSLEKARPCSMVVGCRNGTAIPPVAKPLSTAKSTRSAWVSAMRMDFAPEILHIAAHKMPTAPAPKMRIELPCFSDARR